MRSPCWNRPATSTATCARRPSMSSSSPSSPGIICCSAANADAIAMIDDILPTAERLDLTREAIELLVTRGPALAGIGRIREGIVTLVGAVAASNSYGLVDAEIRARVNLSFAAAGEDPQLAYRVAREGVEMVQRLGIRGWRVHAQQRRSAGHPRRRLGLGGARGRGGRRESERRGRTDAPRGDPGSPRSGRRDGAAEASPTSWPT